MNKQNQTTLIAAFYNLTVVTVLCSLGVMTATYMKHPFKADAAIVSAEHLHRVMRQRILCVSFWTLNHFGIINPESIILNCISNRTESILKTLLL